MSQLNEQRIKIEPLFNEGIRLWKAGDYAAALAILRKLFKQHPRHPSITDAIGSIYREMGKLRKAKDFFQRTVELSPESELASRALFHTLFSLGHKEEAFAEMNRFLSVADSTEYRLLINQINSALVESPGDLANILNGPGSN